MKKLPLRICILALLLLFVSADANAQFWKKKKNKKAKTESQAVFNYEQEFKSIDSFIELDQPKTAREKTIALKQRTRIERQTGYYIKAVDYELALIVKVEENDEINKLKWDWLQNEIKTAENEALVFLYMDAASMLKGIYGQSRYNTERIADDSSGNPENWSQEELNKKINAFIDQSLALAANLKLDKKYEPVISNISRYDFALSMQQVMARRAISILNGLTVPNDTKYRSPDSKDAMAEVSVFLRKDFKAAVDPKNEYRILQLYQLVLTSYHIYFDMERLNYAKDAFDESEELFIGACENIIRQHPGDPFSNLASIALARVYHEQDPAKALSIIDEAIKRHPGFEQNVELQNIRGRVLKPVLGMEMEQVNQPGKKMLARVQYSNIEKVYIRAYAIDYLDYLAIGENYYDDETRSRFFEWLGLQEGKSSKKYELELPRFYDYKSHSAEIPLDSLRKGIWLLVISNRADFRDSLAVVNYAISSVSNYVFVNNKRLFLLHAADGLPASGMPYKIYKTGSWDHRNNEFIKEGKTNNDGSIDPVAIEGYYNSYLIVLNGQELTYIWNEYREGGKAEDALNGQVLLDRSIYRPGQTVFFKGIVYREISKNVVLDQYVKVVLKDNNYEEKGVLVMKTNQYGSVHGSFVLPKGGFNTGSFHIELFTEKQNIGSTYFRVEEYKRPKYTATISAPEKAYKLYDKVSVQGEARALAGYAVQDARVSYSVTRRLKPRYWGWGEYGDLWKWGSVGMSMTIATGDTMTDKEGKFVISFVALPDEAVDKKANPYFIYEIDATVTDINGEVRTSSYSMTMAYTDIELSISGESEYLQNQPVILEFSSTNLQGKALPFTGSIRLRKIIENTAIQRERLWDEADTMSMTAAEFRQWFPQYSKGGAKEEFKDITMQEFRNDKTGKWTIQSKLMNEAGEYVAIISAKDGRGEIIEDEFRFTLNSSSPGKYDLPDALKLIIVNGHSFEPGQTARVLIGSGLDKAIARIEVRSLRGKILEKEITLSKNSQWIEIPVQEGDRGNLVVDAYLVHDYRLYTDQVNIRVPYSNKQLQLKLNSFRNDMEPGSKEKWTVSLKGPAAEKAAMETVAAMYDQSLDELYQGPDWNMHLYNDFSVYQGISSSIQLTQFSTLKEIEEGAYSYKSFLFPEYKNEFLYHVNGSEIYLWNFGDVRGGAFTLNSPRLNFSNKNSGSIEKANMENGQYNAYYTLTADESDGDGVKGVRDREQSGSGTPVIRKNFNETAFFFPNLFANAKGEIILEFTMPEALTKWKMMMLSHSTTMQLGYLEQSITTSKKVMVQPNMPRFLRQGDRISIAVKIINTTKKAISAKVSIKVTDEETGKVLSWLSDKNDKDVSVPAGGNSACSFTLDIPDYTGIVSVAIYATAGNYSDGEQNTLLVLSKRNLVTETLPITIRKQGTQNLEFSSLKNNNSTTLKHEKLSVEMSSNPAWYAVQALPYMMEFPHECAEQVFTRFYANSIGMHLANSDPAIRKVYESWEREAANGTGLQSKLMQNQDLKSSLIEETPWLNDAKNETERMRKLGLLFNHDKMKEELENAFGKLKDMQLSNGSWSWFKGMQESEYITQTIVIGFGKMKKMGVDISACQDMVRKAISYLDEVAKKDYQHHHSETGIRNFYPVNLQYLYCKSYFPTIGLTDTSRVLQYYIANAELTWNQNSLLNRAQLATAIHILKPSSGIPQLIMTSFNENAKQSDEMGMYWPKNTGGCYWYEAPLETQAAIIEAYSQLGTDKQVIHEQQVWLMRQKQSQGWGTTRSTADACYALLMNGRLLDSKQDVSVSVNNARIVPEKKQEGTGYFRQNIPAENVSRGSGNISVTATTSDFAYGAVYWQYFEDMDRVKNTGSGLSITKRLYKVVRTNTGEQKVEVKAGDVLHVGDIIEVSLSISSDRRLEFVHIKDQRASGTEPTDVLSEYRWQNGLGYYQSTRDASTNFFIDNMAKGNFQLNYTLKVEQAGIYNSGMATAQCMYAPEYAANSKAIILKVE